MVHLTELWASVRCNSELLGTTPMLGTTPIQAPPAHITLTRSALIAESLHVKPGKGAAFVRTKLKHQISGNSSDKTFRAGETVATADIAKQESQYTYADGNEVGCLIAS